MSGKTGILDTNRERIAIDKMKPLKLTLLLGAAVAAMNLSALAGPGQQVYRPLSSTGEISALKPGTQIAHQCPKCGAITVSKATKDQSHAKGFTCPMCRMEYTYRDAGGGKGGKVGFVDCVDTKTGKKMSARVCALQK